MKVVTTGTMFTMKVILNKVHGNVFYLPFAVKVIPNADAIIVVIITVCWLHSEGK